MDINLQLFYQLLPPLIKKCLIENKTINTVVKAGDIKSLQVECFKNRNIVLLCYSFSHFKDEIGNNLLTEVFQGNLADQQGITTFAYEHLHEHSLFYLLLALLCNDIQQLQKCIDIFLPSEGEIHIHDDQERNTYRANVIWIKQYVSAIKNEIENSLKKGEVQAYEEVMDLFMQLQFLTMEKQKIVIANSQVAVGMMKAGMNYKYQMRLHLISFLPNSREIISMLQEGPHQNPVKQILVENHRSVQNKRISWDEWSEYMLFLPREFHDTVVGPLVTLKRLLYEPHVLPSPRLVEMLPNTYIHPRISPFITRGQTEKGILLQQLICLNLETGWEMIWRKMGWSTQEEMLKRLHFYKTYEVKDIQYQVSARDWIRLLFIG